MPTTMPPIVTPLAGAGLAAAATGAGVSPLVDESSDVLATVDGTDAIDPQQQAIVPAQDAFIARPDQIIAQIQDRSLVPSTDVAPREPRLHDLIARKWEGEERYNGDGRYRWYYKSAAAAVPCRTMKVVSREYDEFLQKRTLDIDHNRYVDKGVFAVSPDEATRWRYSLQTVAVQFAEVLTGFVFHHAPPGVQQTALERLLTHLRGVAQCRLDHILRPSDIPDALAGIIGAGCSADDAREAVIQLAQGNRDAPAAQRLAETWRKAEYSWSELVSLLNHVDGKKVPPHLVNSFAHLLRIINRDQGTNLDDVYALKNDCWSDVGWCNEYNHINEGPGDCNLWLGWVATLAGLKLPGVLGDRVVIPFAADIYKMAETAISHILRTITDNRRILPACTDAYDETALRFLAHELWLRWSAVQGGKTGFGEGSFLEWTSVEAQKIVGDEGLARVTVVRAGEALPSRDDAGLDAGAAWVAGLSLYAPQSSGTGAWRASIQGGAEMLAATLARYAFEGEGMRAEAARKKEILAAAREAAIDAHDHVIMPAHVKSALAMIAGAMPTGGDWEELVEGSGLPAGISGALEVWKGREIASPASANDKDKVLHSRAEIGRLSSATAEICELLARLGPGAIAKMKKVLAEAGAGTVSDAEMTLLLWELLKRSGMRASEASLVNMDQVPQALAAIRRDASDEFERYSGAWMRRFGPRTRGTG